MKRILFVLVAAIAMATIAGLGIASAQDKGGTTTQDTTTDSTTPADSTTSEESSSAPSTKATSTSFSMVRSQAAVAHNCLKGAKAAVNINTVGPNQVMAISLSGMPKNTEFTVFVLQVPNSPFGVSWYQGDIDTNSLGQGKGTFKGIFSEETFTIAPGVAPAAHVDSFDAAFNPAFKPVHGFHLGLWFAIPAQANQAGCSATVTPFDGDHIAGIQALSTRNFNIPDPNTNNPNTGPLRRIQ